MFNFPTSGIRARFYCLGIVVGVGLKMEESSGAAMIRPRLKISVSMDISILAFYEYIGYIGDISVDIFL